MVLTKSEKLERERAITEQLKQDKPVSEIAHDLHISFTDISRVKKKYEEEQEKVQSESNVVQSDVTEPNKDQKFDLSTEEQLNLREERDNLKEQNRALRDKTEELTNITLELGEENRALKHKKIELDFKLKHKYIESRSGIIAVQTKSLYDDAYRLLDQDVEYCYLVYRNNRYERLVDAAQFEADRAKARRDEEQKQQIDNKFEAQDDGSIC
jgi:hypothetical protein